MYKNEKIVERISVSRILNMGRTNKSDLFEDESLSNEVQKYLCLYDKGNKGYKERDRRSNAWRRVESELGLEEGTAEKRFDAIKKRYNRKKNALKSKKNPGSGLKDVEEAENSVKEYSFLSWLDSYQTEKNIHKL